jgi:GT2 family glycosyltransferase
VVCSDRQIETLHAPNEGSILFDISDQAIGQRKIQLDERDKAVELLHGWIAERDQRIQKYDEDLATLHTWVAERDAHIAKQTADIGAFMGWIAERDERIAKQEADLAATQDRLALRESELSEQHEEFATRFRDLEQLLASRDEHIQKLHAYATEQAQELGRLQAYVHGVQSSIAWKIAARAKKLRERVLPSGGAIARSYRLTRRAAQVWREQGGRAVIQKASRRILRRGAGPYAAPTSAASAAAAQDTHDQYQRWIAEHEPTAEQLEQQAQAARELGYQPLISILTPVYNPGPAIVEALIESVIAQTYPHWELWLIDGSPDNRQVSDLLQTYTAADSRIHHLSLESNQGIVGNTNLGLPHAQGEFVAFVDHDDVLAPFALYEVAKLLNEQPQADLIYSDSDLLSSDGARRFQPLFKPDWSPAIMLSANYATHLCVVRTKLLVDLGGLTPGSDGAQDWDLILRVSERSSAIAHIPKILYHWRESLISTATDIKRKPYVMSAQLTAITQHLQRQGLAAHAFFDTNGFIRVTWPLLTRPLVSIIIPSRSPELLQRCISSILTRTDYQEFEILVVDTTPRATIRQRYSSQDSSRLRVIHYTDPFNYSAVNNLAARSAKGDILLFLNDDTEVIDSEWLSEMVRWADRDQVGVVGAKLLYADGRIQHAGVVVGLDGFAGHPFAGGCEGQQTIYGCVEWYRNYSAVTGACLMIRRALFEQVGGFDEDLVLCGNDVELCLRVRDRGYQVLYTPFARMRHHESATRGASAIPPSDYERSYQHYLPLLSGGDPYYNPNLSPWSAIPQLHQRSEKLPLVFVQQFLRQLPRPVEHGEAAMAPGGQ